MQCDSIDIASMLPFNHHQPEIVETNRIAWARMETKCGKLWWRKRNCILKCIFNRIIYLAWIDVERGVCECVHVRKCWTIVWCQMKFMKWLTHFFMRNLTFFNRKTSISETHWNKSTTTVGVLVSLSTCTCTAHTHAYAFDVCLCAYDGRIDIDIRCCRSFYTL